MRIRKIKRKNSDAFRRSFKREWSRVAPDVVWNPHEYTFGLFEGNRPLGYTYFEINGGVGRLSEFLVKGRSRNEGRGKALMEHFRRFCKGRGCHKLVLETSEEHTEAIAFYERYGFTREATHRNDKNGFTWYTYSMFLR